MLLPLITAEREIGAAVGTSIRKFALASANGAVGLRNNLSVLVEPLNVTVCIFPFASFNGTHPKVDQPVVGTEKVPRKLVVCSVVPHPPVKTDRIAWD